MTEYCSVVVSESWEPDTNPNVVVEYTITDEKSDIESQSNSVPTVSWDHLSSESLHVTKRCGDDGDNNSSHCQITLQCKPLYGVSVVEVWVASEARIVELYDARDGSYLHTVRGEKDREDSEADNSRIHYLCHCHLDRPLAGITVKFLSLGQRVSFEIAHIRVLLGVGFAEQGGGGAAMSQQSIDMERLRRDVDDMGDAVSDRAKAFLTTLEAFQKNKHGAVDDLRHLLLDKNSPEGQSMAGITTLLAMFASLPARGSNPSPSNHPPADSTPMEGSGMNHMLTQMMSSLAVGTGGESRGGNERGDMYAFLQTVCGQVSQQRAQEEALIAQTAQSALAEGGEGMDVARGESPSSLAATTEELEGRVTAQVEALVESRLSAVEEHIKQQVDQRMEELETRVTGKLDAIFALLQAQKQS